MNKSIIIGLLAVIAAGVAYPTTKELISDAKHSIAVSKNDQIKAKNMALLQHARDCQLQYQLRPDNCDGETTRRLADMEDDFRRRPQDFTVGTR